MQEFVVSLLEIRKHLVYVNSETSEEAVLRAEEIVSAENPGADYVEVVDVSLNDSPSLVNN